MASPASTLKSDRSDGHASQVIELQGGHEVDRLLWRYLQQGTDIMLQHVSGKIRRRLDNMSKSLDYLESNTTMLLQRLRRKGTQQPVDAVEGSDNDTCSVMSSDDTSKPEGGTGRELVVACRGADGALSTRVNVRESDSWSDVRSAIEKSLRTSHNRGIQKIFFQDLTGNLISLDSESSWTLCKSLQSLKEQRHISLVIKDQDKPSALRHPLTASRPDDALSAHVPSGDFLHAQAHGAVVLKDEIRNHSSYDAPTRSNSDPGRARLLKLKPPPLKSKEARSSAVMREHGEHFVSSSTLSLKNMKISNLKEVGGPAEGGLIDSSCLAV
uniref:PB1 domain-containing protein n=1 Tax=Guillardia theta TaxID=55529 RepID=A0A6U5Z5V1_GUITH|mmetsp:Transcript_24279/g.79186  ORF Transcript_24279/g.79186 Transcript_24279/m.79186 type:complete len:327 (+) Transcript_24279:146-1126(+)